MRFFKSGVIIFCATVICLIFTETALAQCTSPEGLAGSFRYIEPDFHYCDGSSWQTMAASPPLRMSCTKEGELSSNGTYLRYCNGSYWVPASGGDTGETCTAEGKIAWYDDGAYLRWCDGLGFWRFVGPRFNSDIIIDVRTGSGASDRNVTLPLYGTVNANIDWGDPTANANCATSVNTSGYANPDRIIRVRSWGDVGLTSLIGAFNGATNIIFVAEPPPTVTKMNAMFLNAPNYNQDIGHWNTSNVTDMYAMFQGASSFNQDIGASDVSQVSRLSAMFFDAVAFNQDIGNWDTSGSTNFGFLFRGASSFNQDISRWDTSRVTNMRAVFVAASSFNPRLSINPQLSPLKIYRSGALTDRAAPLKMDLSKLLSVAIFEIQLSDYLSAFPL